jgi:hypothetical protein
MMQRSRRTFLLAAGVSWMLPGLPLANESAARIIVLDKAFAQYAPWHANARISLLDGDAGWLWHDHLMHEAIKPAQSIIGLTRYADAFVLTQLATHAGFVTTQNTFDRQAVAWSIRCSEKRNAR